MVFLSSELDADSARQGYDSVIVISNIPDFLKIFMIALPFQSPFVNCDISGAVVGKIHAQGGSQNPHFLFPACFTDGNTFIAAENQDFFAILDIFDDFLDRFFICNNHLQTSFIKG
jgi:hypothetical protein